MTIECDLIKYKSPRATHCKGCAESTIKVEWDKFPGDVSQSQYVGILSKREADTYASLCKKDEASHRFSEMGYAVVDDNSINTPREVLFNDMMTILTSEGQEETKMEYLAHDLIGKTGYKTTDHRTWKQLYPRSTETTNLKPNTGNRRNELSNHVREMFIPFAERILFPHHYFARVAYHNATVVLGGKVEAVHMILFLKKVNALVKGPRLCERQTIHCDGTGWGVVAILIKLCGKGGYDFHLMPMTHNLIEYHEDAVNQGRPFPVDRIKKVTVRRNQVLFFVDSLMHAGGTTSMDKTEYELWRAYQKKTPPLIGAGVCRKRPWVLPQMKELSKTQSLLPQIHNYEGWFKNLHVKGEEYPTDVSMQLSFQFNPVSTGFELGRAQPKWYINEATNEEVGAKFDGLIERNKDLYTSAVATSMGRWIETLTTNYKARNTRSQGNVNLG